MQYRIGNETSFAILSNRRQNSNTKESVKDISYNVYVSSSIQAIANKFVSYLFYVSEIFSIWNRLLQVLEIIEFITSQSSSYSLFFLIHVFDKDSNSWKFCKHAIMIYLVVVIIVLKEVFVFIWNTHSTRKLLIYTNLDISRIIDLWQRIKSKCVWERRERERERERELNF